MIITNMQQDQTIKLQKRRLQDDQAVMDRVTSIIENVKQDGDRALYELTKQFDGANLSSLFVSKEEVNAAYSAIQEDELAAIRKAIKNVRVYHEEQYKSSWIKTREDGTMLGQKVTPLDTVGLYVPGGKAAYPSSVIMNAVPALVAGVGQIALASPPDEDGQLPAGVLVAANELGLTSIYKMGGAQAIAAFAYGTETVKKVDKVTGPGNQYVALAKRAVFGEVDIDMIAGPSEICVLADEGANVRFIAADLLSQAEHDELASAILVTTSSALAERVQMEVAQQLDELSRPQVAKQSIADYGQIYVCESIDQAVKVVNELACEHVEIMTEEPMDMLGKIKHAGAIFIGPYSAEVVGDYIAGPSHVLPTNGTAKFSSPLSVDDFIKKTSIISYSKQAFQADAQAVMSLAQMEGLEAHAKAIEVRLQED
ncbi:histidinol dehydrogenase [Shouchella sp. 1P09AA]|uniref:histidinol dehydrogenase n=1 Tax=unclassified Shouchella TaxID=2893065 RepID=UPI0039A33FDF